MSLHLKNCILILLLFHFFNLMYTPILMSDVLSGWVLQDPAHKVYFPMKINFEDLSKEIILMETRNGPPISLEICGQC